MRSFVADWLKDRLDGEPMESQHVLIDMAGQTHISSFENAHGVQTTLTSAR
jgi:hypothetical protein